MQFSKKIKWIKNYLTFTFITHLQADILSPLNNLIIFYQAEKFIVLPGFSGGLSWNDTIHVMRLIVRQKKF